MWGFYIYRHVQVCCRYNKKHLTEAEIICVVYNTNVYIPNNIWGKDNNCTITDRQHLNKKGG